MGGFFGARTRMRLGLMRDVRGRASGSVRDSGRPLRLVRSGLSDVHRRSPVTGVKFIYR